MNKIEIRKTVEKINKAKSRFFEKINKIGKPLSKVDQEKEKTHESRVKEGTLLLPYRNKKDYSNTKNNCIPTN